jgi:heat shock protein HslJ
MKLQDLDDPAPPEPDDHVLFQVRARSTKLRTRRRRGTTTGLVVTVALVIAGAGAVGQHTRTPDRRVAVRVPPATGPVLIAGAWTPRSVAGYSGPIDNYRWRVAPRLHFDGRGRWSGADGCNDLGGSYDLSSTGAFHAISEGGTTVRCDPPFFPTTGILSSTARVERHDDQLAFVDADDKVVATYALVPNQSQSTDWASEVNDVRKNGGAAYVSEPVNITGAGRYTLVFGPLLAADAARVPRALQGSNGVSFAGDTTFDGQSDSTRLVRFERNGSIYLRMPFIVDNYRSEYDGFRVLLQD